MTITAQPFKKLPVGISDFKEIITQNYAFVDKSLFIREVVEEGTYVCAITRPRGFGKTVNMSMLENFLCHHVKEDLFTGLLIKNHPEFCAKYQNKRPVIFLSFKNVKHENFQGAMECMAEIFSQLYKKHEDVLEGDFLWSESKKDFMRILDKNIDNPYRLERALTNLMRYLKKRYEKSVVVLIDQCDTPLEQGRLNGYESEIGSFMSRLFESALKDNSDLSQGILTGVTWTCQSGIFSGFNNVCVSDILDSDYSSCFGFTEEEVISLLPENLQIEPMRQWYGGYEIGGIHLYNPFSVIHCLDNHGILDNYWIQSSDNHFILKFLENPESYRKEALETLIAKTPKEHTVDRDGRGWTGCIHRGYAKLTGTSRGYWAELLGNLEVPNTEIMGLYEEIYKNIPRKKTKAST